MRQKRKSSVSLDFSEAPRRWRTDVRTSVALAIRTKPRKYDQLVVFKTVVYSGYVLENWFPWVVFIAALSFFKIISTLNTENVWVPDYKSKFYFALHKTRNSLPPVPPSWLASLAMSRGGRPPMANNLITDLSILCTLSINQFKVWINLWTFLASLGDPMK